MNEKVTPEELVKALRCSAIPHETCTGCPYDRAESLEPIKERFPGNEVDLQETDSDGLYHFCDVDRIALDAADMIEAATEKQKTCPLCHDAYMEIEACNFTVAISDIIPMPEINLTTDEKEENARPPFPALIIGNVDEGQDFLPIEFCPFCGRKL